MAVKMKFSFVLLLLLDFPHLNGQERIKEFEPILLRLKFPSVYNSDIKSCCKLEKERICNLLLDSTGYTYELLRGRVTKTEGDGWIEFIISNVTLEDAGFYRCSLLERPDIIFIYMFVVFTESSIPNSSSQPPLTTTIKTISTSTSRRPQSTGPVLSQDNADSPSKPWSFGLPLLVVVSITVMIVITLVIIGVVCCRLKEKPEQPVAEAEMAQTQTVYTEATPEQLEQQQQQGIYYDVITFTDE